MKFVIPQEFKLGGHVFKVNLEKDVLTVEGEYGSFNEVNHTIRLQSPDPVPVSRVESTFLHELLHAILFELGERELDKNERLIDSIASLLHQALTTGEGDILNDNRRKNA